MGIRLWLSPVFGVLIPSFSGLVDPVRHGAAGLLATYVYFSFCAFIIWTTNRWLYLRLPRREDWLENPLRRIGVLDRKGGDRPVGLADVDGAPVGDLTHRKLCHRLQACAPVE